MKTQYKKQIGLICSVIALFCFISIYMPVIAPRFPAVEYYAPSGSYESEYYLSGDYFYAREYWSISRFAFADRSIVIRVVLSLGEALLIYWAFYAVRGEAGRIGIVIAGLNLGITAFMVIRMLGVMGYCRWGVLTVMALVAVAAVVVAALDRSVSGKETQQ